MHFECGLTNETKRKPRQTTEFIFHMSEEGWKKVALGFLVQVFFLFASPLKRRKTQKSQTPHKSLSSNRMVYRLWGNEEW